MKKLIPIVLITAVLLLLIFLQSHKKHVGLTIFMAASTTNLVQELAELYKKEKGIDINLNPASSGVLAKQIKNGAAADIFISASEKWVDYIDEEIINQSVMVKNSMVLISPIGLDETENSDSLTTLKTRLSIGDPAHVPAGSYAKDILQYYNLYNLLKPRFILASNVRAALSVVELGEVDLGIVYKTDALMSDKVKIIRQFPKESHKEINYYCAELRSDNPYKKDFYNFILTSDKVKELYIKHGFIPGN